MKIGLWRKINWGQCHRGLESKPWVKATKRDFTILRHYSLRVTTIMMPSAKRQRLEVDPLDDENAVLSSRSDSGDENSYNSMQSAYNSSAESLGTEEDIADAMRAKSKKTLKRKHRATDPTRFGATLQALLDTSAPTPLPLSLKPDVARKRNDAKLESKARRVIKVERKEVEETGRVRDIIGGWGGESERALRKVAQRGGTFKFGSWMASLDSLSLVVKLFNAIQQTQASAAAVAEETKTLRGSGKPTLPAPSLEKKGKQKGKNKDNPLGRGKESAIIGLPIKCFSIWRIFLLGALDKDDFMNMIRSGGVVSRVWYYPIWMFRLP
jgi:hypothetical protein